MIFDTLYESALKGELILIEEGYCRYHLRKDGQLTIYEIISLRPGAGSEILDKLLSIGASSLFAKCPVKLSSNAWYAKKGFVLEGVEKTPSGTEINLWRLPLQ